MAKTQIDVYKDWLGIEAANRPLNYYQLLGFKSFEDNPEVIRANYRKFNAHVRKYATGDYMAESQALLNELAKAMLCLTDSSRKLEYDASLGRKTAASGVRRTLEQILLDNNLVPPEQMKSVKNYADAVGIDLHEAVLQRKLAAPETVMLAYAESIGLPFISIEDIGVDEQIAPQINPNTARQHSFVPLMVDNGQLLLASPRPVNPDVEEELRMVFEMPVRSTICTPAEANAAIAKYYPRDAVQLIKKKDGTTAAAKQTKVAKKQEEKDEEEREPMSDEEKKNRLMNTIVAFNFTAMAICFGLYLFVFSPSFKNNFWAMVPTLIFAAAVCGGTAAFITWKKSTR
ncbi:MAG: hypothetical protein FWE67_12055 [Planctomycetaceae bacterium]|nr:hypothetical protein [Planctomycetaceae bacterium]